MEHAFRLPKGGRIDRSRPIRFTFNGRTIEGYAGDTLASALLANGIHLVGRSFKYHRPRGILSHGSDEPSALLSVDRGRGRIDPNNRASVVAACDCLKTESQNHWPTLGFDIGAVNDLFSPLFVAGFYYKTFMWPRTFWDRLYEPVIRAAAGLGKAPTEPDPDRYANRHAHCDVLIVGAGPTGLAAALAASQRDHRVILVDEGEGPGGALLHAKGATIEGKVADDWIVETLATLDSRPNVIFLPRTTAFGYYNHNHVAMIERISDHLASPPKGMPRERLWQVRAKQVILAQGAHERPLVFDNNDRPGIMLAESLRAFVNRYAVLPGRRIVFVTNGASAYTAAEDVKAAGLEVALVDYRREGECGPEAARLRTLGCEVLTGHTVITSRGRKRVRGLLIAHVSPEGRIGKKRLLSCDCVGMSGGWTPAVHLFSQSRGKLRYDEAIDAFVPSTSAQDEQTVGAANGNYKLAGCLEEGFAAGAAAIGTTSDRRFLASATATGFKPVRTMPTDAKPFKVRAFLDFQNDVTAKDVKLAVREGFESIEHVKRYTTTGMATDQGKTSNMNALGIVGEALGRPLPSVGTTTFRPPYTPVTFGCLVGPARDDLFEPIRTTPIHDWAVEKGAIFENVALWRRAWYFPRGGEDLHAAVARECKAVRRSVGIFDASTLGKIEIVGRDAAEFMNRMYVNAWLKLQPGRCRYGLMLKEDGYVLDDGVVARVAADRFHVTTTTGGAPRVLTHMEDYLQTEWPDLNVHLTSTTEQWAVIAVQGPRARDTIAPLVDIDMSPEAFPHMSMRLGTIQGVRCRLFRVSFTGELGYEINVPADYARSIWDAICTVGRRFDITPYGTETMHVLRAEKGFIIIGQETDGTVTPDDLGMAGMIAKSKSDFVGRRSLDRPDLASAGRKQLVGLQTDDSTLVLDEGAQIVRSTVGSKPIPMLGHVTSSYWSSNCNRSIAMALVTDGRALLGSTLFATTRDGFAKVKLVEPVFFDAKGERLDA